MAYKMDYRSLKEMYDSIKGDISAWNFSLSQLAEVLDTFVTNGYIEGEGADSIMLYINTIHRQGLIPSLSQLIGIYISKFEMYYNEYLRNIDNNEDARFHSAELRDIESQLSDLQKSTINIETDVINTLNRISDIFQCSRRDATDVLGLTRSIKNEVNQLDDDIISLERKHSAEDFVNISELIKSDKALISECISKSRSFKSDFNANSFALMGSASAFISANVKIYQELEQNKEKYIEASENVQKHVAAIEEIEAQERAERERIATAIKIGVAIVAGAVTIVATGGTAAPLVIGLVSAGTAIVNKATDEILDEYVENGNLKEMNWKGLAIDCAVAGTTGFISGYVGGGLTKTLKGVGPLSKLADSNNPIIRIAGNAAIGTTSDIVTDVANNTITATGDWAKTGFKKGEFHAEMILGLEKGEEVTLENVGKEFLNVAAGNVVKSGIGEGFDSFKKSKTDIFDTSNSVKRTVTYGLYGATEEIVTGIGERATEAFIEGDDVAKKTFDIEEMAKDAVKGGVEGAHKAKDHSEHVDSSEVYKKTYYTKDDNGNVVKIVNNDGSSRYRIDKNDDYKNTSTPKGTEYDKQYIREGGKITTDKTGNVVYHDSADVEYEKDHPIKTALNEAFVTGEKAKNTTFYDSNGNVDESRSTYNYRDIQVGDLPDDILPESKESKGSYEYNVKNRFVDINDTVWATAIQE